jgi:hypothetical protein
MPDHVSATACRRPAPSACAPDVHLVAEELVSYLAGKAAPAEPAESKRAASRHRRPAGCIRGLVAA